jgi:hypothetical protein
MKKLNLVSLLVLVAMLFLSVAAFSDTLTLTGVGPGNTFSGPGETAYTYPYEFTINGTPGTALLCDDWADNIYVGESWKATLQTGAQAASFNYLGVANPTADYNEAAWLFTQLNGSNDASVNAAIWALFDPSVVPYLGNAPGAQTLYNNAANYAGVYNPNVGFYTPIVGTQTEGGRPQEFLVKTPESPMSLMLAADFLGLLTLFGISRKLGWKMNF